MHFVEILLQPAARKSIGIDSMKRCGFMQGV